MDVGGDTLKGIRYIHEYRLDVCSNGALRNGPVARAIRAQEIERFPNSVAALRLIAVKVCPLGTPTGQPWMQEICPPSIPFSPSLAEPGAIAQGVLGAQA